MMARRMIAARSGHIQISSLFANSELGGYYPIRPEYLYEDSAGLIPAVVDGVAGLQFDAKGKPERRRNVLKWSEDFSGSDWVKIQSTVSDTNKLVEDGVATGGHIWNQSAPNGVQVADEVRITIKLGYGFKRYAGLGLSGTGIGVFTFIVVDLLEKSALVANGAASVGIEDAGDGLVVSVTRVASAAGSVMFTIYGMSGPNFADRNYPGTEGLVALQVLSVHAALNAPPTPYQKITTGIGGEWTPGNHAWQDTTANKPYLRQTPITGKYWLDGDTATAALNVTFTESLGANCTVARVRPEGVEWLESQTIGTAYNLITPYAYNSDTLIINRALTAREKAQVERLLRRSVPRLGDELIVNGDFSDGTTGWALGLSSTVENGELVAIANGSSGDYYNYQALTGPSNRWYQAKAQVTQGSFFSGIWEIGPISGYIAGIATRGVGNHTLLYKTKAAGTHSFSFVANSGGSTSGSTNKLDNISVREIQ